MPRKSKTEATTTENPTEVPMAQATETMPEPTSTEPAPTPTPEPPKPKKPRKKKEPSIAGVATLADLAAAYSTQMEADGKSNGTIASYGMELRLAQDELGAETTLTDLTPERLAEFYVSKRVTKLRSGKAKSQLRSTRRAACFASRSCGRRSAGSSRRLRSRRSRRSEGKEKGRPRSQGVGPLSLN